MPFPNKVTSTGYKMNQVRGWKGSWGGGTLLNPIQGQITNRYSPQSKRLFAIVTTYHSSIILTAQLVLKSWGLFRLSKNQDLKATHKSSTAMWLVFPGVYVMGHLHLQPLGPPIPYHSGILTSPWTLDFGCDESSLILQSHTMLWSKTGPLAASGDPVPSHHV